MRRVAVSPEAMATLEVFPGAGQRVRHAQVPGVRRILLRVSRYHVYYASVGAELRVVAVWSAVRGNGPDLRGI